MAVDGRGCWTSGQPKLNNPSCRGCGCRKRESERSKPPLSVSPLQHQRASEGAARRRTAQQQYPRTTAHNTAHSTQARACGTAHCSLAPVPPWPRALHTSHRLLQSCDRPQPPTVICIPFDSSEPSPPLLSPAKARPCLTLLLNQTLCKLSPLPFGVRPWCDYVAGVGLARSPIRTACKELQQVLQLPACSGIQSAGSASASHLQAVREKAAACAEVRAVHSHHPSPSPHTAAVASLPLTCYFQVSNMCP